MSLDQALEIQEFANRHGSFVMEGLMYLGAPGKKFIKQKYELVQSGSWVRSNIFMECLQIM